MRFLFRRCRLLCLAVLCSLSVLRGTKAADLIWSAGTLNGSPVNGSGTWNSGTYFFDLFWDLYKADPADTIQFGLAPVASPNRYTVTLGENSEVAGLIFNESYSLTSASPFTLTIGSASGIQVVEGIASIGGGSSRLRVKLGADQTWTNSSVAGDFSVGAAVDFNGRNLALVGAFGTTTVLAGSLSLGNSTLSTSGVGTTVLSGSISITGGTMLLNSTGSTLLSGVLTGGSQATLLKQNIGALTVTDVAGLNVFGAGITLGNGSLILATDTNAAATGANITSENLGAPTIVVKQNTTAAYRTVTLGGLNLGPQDLTVTPSNGFGLVFSGTSYLGDGGYAISVSGVQASNLIPGLTFTGVIAGTGTFVKKGTGTMVLSNAANSFGGGTGEFRIDGGTLAADSDEALGPVGNVVRLNTNNAAQGFRAAGDITTTRTFALNTAANGIEVIGGKTLTLLTPFTLGAANSALQKNDQGTLELAAANSAWNGLLTVAAGAVRVSNTAALGTGTGNTVVSGNGAALQLPGGLTLAEPFNLTGAGINSAGAIQALSGANVLTGTVNLVTGPTSLGADAGASLALAGSLSGGQALTFAGAGSISIGGVFGTMPASFNQLGSGRTSLTVAGTAFVGGLTVNAGTFALSNAGRIGGAGAITVNAGATLDIDDSASVIASRLGGRAFTLFGGNLVYTGSAASNSTEALGNAAFNRGLNTLTVVAGGSSTGTQLHFGTVTRNTQATALFRGASLGTVAGPGVATIRSTNGGFLFSGAQGAAGTANKGIVPWALVDTSVSGAGISFATMDTATSAIRPLNGSEYTTNALTAGTNNILLNGATALSTPSVSLNSLTLADTGSLTVNPGQTLTLASGGILALGTYTGAGISGGILTSATNELIVHAVGDLDLNTTLTANGFTKSGAGTLTISQRSYTGSANVGIYAGTLRLAGGNNTLRPSSYLVLNGGNLDLNGTGQWTFATMQENTASTSAAGSVFGNENSALAIGGNTSRTFYGVMSGSMALSVAQSGQTTTFYGNNTYTGNTVVNGGVLTLTDGGRLSGTSQLDINYAGLTFAENGLTDLTGTARINPNAPVNLRGATLLLTGRPQTASQQILGGSSAVNLLEGFNNITATAGGTGINSADLVLNWNRPANSSAVVNFATAAGGNAASGQMGNVGRVLFSTDPVTTQNLLGPWAISIREFVGYQPGVGVGALNAVGFAGYAPDSVLGPITLSNGSAFADSSTVVLGGTANLRVGMQVSSPWFAPGTTITSLSGGTVILSGTATSNGTGTGLGDISFAVTPVTLPTDNVKVTTLTAGSVLTGGTVINTLNLSPATGGTLNLSGGTLTLAGGGLILGHVANTATISINNGFLTGGTGGATDLYVHALPYGGTTRTFSLGAVIADNGGPLRLVISSSEAAGSGNSVTLTAVNTYTGGTVLNQGAVVIASGAVLPGGGLVLNNASLSQAAGGTFTAQAVTMNGAAAALTFSGNNTISSLPSTTAAAAQATRH
jgi:autotransporter-associated beta strand protein